MTSLAHVCVMDSFYAWHGSFSFSQTHSYVWLVVFYVWHGAYFLSRTRVFRYLTCSYLWHDSCIHVAWLVHTCDTTRSYVWHDSFVCLYAWPCVKYLLRTLTYIYLYIYICVFIYINIYIYIYICVCSALSLSSARMHFPTCLFTSCLTPTHSRVWLISFVCLTLPIHTCDINHSHMWPDTFICVYHFPSHFFLLACSPWFSRSLPVLLAWASQIPHKTQVSFAGLFSYLLASFGLFGACSQRYLYQRVRYSDRHGYSNRHRSIDAGLFCRTLVSFADLCWYTLVSFAERRSLLQVSFAEHWSLLQISVDIRWSLLTYLAHTPNAACISELDTRHNTGLFCRSLLQNIGLFCRSASLSAS